MFRPSAPPRKNMTTRVSAPTLRGRGPSVMFASAEKGRPAAAAPAAAASAAPEITCRLVKCIANSLPLVGFKCRVYRRFGQTASTSTGRREMPEAVRSTPPVSALQTLPGVSPELYGALPAPWSAAHPYSRGWRLAQSLSSYPVSPRP